MLVRMDANKRAVCLWSFNDQEPGRVCAVKILALGSHPTLLLQEGGPWASKLCLSASPGYWEREKDGLPGWLGALSEPIHLAL